MIIPIRNIRNVKKNFFLYFKVGDIVFIVKSMDEQHVDIASILKMEIVYLIISYVKFAVIMILWSTVFVVIWITLFSLFAKAFLFGVDWFLFAFKMFAQYHWEHLILISILLVGWLIGLSIDLFPLVLIQ